MSGESRPLRILSVEDEPQTIAGPLAVLEFAGHSVTRVESVEGAEDVLRRERYDLLILDQRLPRRNEPRYDGGSSLALELKAGRLGELNQGAAFVFVTASRSWVVEEEVVELDGFLGIELKGGDLSRTLATMIEALAEPR